MREIFLIALFGAAGTLSRYGLGIFVHRFCGERFPFGTLAVNLIGCWFAGMVMGMAPAGRIWLTVGFLGAFTTFSAFGYDTVRLMQAGAWGAALLNVSANLVFGLLFVWLGCGAGRWLV